MSGAVSMTNASKPVEPSAVLTGDERTARIRALNDHVRQNFIGGMIVVTNGTAALSDADKVEVFAKVQSFENFTADNDPYGEHDFGSFNHSGETFFWKIDCYDLAMINHSPDAADPSVTKRVLTIMKAEEY